MFFCSRTDLSGPGGLADGTSDGKGAGISICLHSPDGAGAVLCPSGPDGGRVTGMPGDALSDLGIYQARGLTRRERQSCFVILTFGMLLFLIGAAFAFEIVLPITLLFFAGMNAGQTISPMVSIESYISFVSTTLVTFGIVFELPVVVIMFTRIGLLNPAMQRKNRKYVILAVFVLAAFITPPDVTSQILVAFPMLFLFEISLLLSRILFRKRLKREMQVNGQEAGDV